MQILFILEIIGTIAFAVSGAVVGIQKKMDIFGVCILGLTAAVGGGILRDLILNITPPAAFRTPDGVWYLGDCLSSEEIIRSGLDTYFVDHTAGVYPTAASGFPWSAASMAVKGDVLADLNEDLAAEQKARVTYDNILRLSDDPDVTNVIRYLREREIVHYQRFGEGLRRAMDRMNEKNLYIVNPSFDRG